MNVHTTPLTIQDRIEIGLPIKQLDSPEYEYPAKLDGQLIGFYASHHAAELALTNIALALDLGIISPLDIMPRLSPEEQRDVDALADHITSLRRPALLQAA